MTILKQYLDQAERLKKKKTSTTDGKLADKTVKFCPRCHRCYDTRYYKDVGNTGKVIYYDDFPSYGKERRTCKRCE